MTILLPVISIIFQSIYVIGRLINNYFIVVSYWKNQFTTALTISNMSARKNQNSCKYFKIRYKSLREFLLGMIENQLLELSDDVYKIKGKDTTENVFSEISEIETLAIKETQLTPEKQ